MLLVLKEIMLFHRDPVVVVHLPFRGETMFQQEIPLTREKGPVHRNEAPPDLITCY